MKFNKQMEKDAKKCRHTSVAPGPETGMLTCQWCSKKLSAIQWAEEKLSTSGLDKKKG